MPEIKVACACIIRKENKFLLVKETKESHKGKYGMPGGTLDLHESLFDCAKREVKEETGLDIGLEKLIKIFNFPKNSSLNTSTFFVFEGKIVGGEITTSTKHPEVNYFSLDEIKDMHGKGIFRQPWVLETFENIDNISGFPIDLIEVKNSSKCESQKLESKYNS